MKKKPRHYQQEAHDIALQHMREASQLNKVGKFVIDAAPATGKTLTMAMIAGSIASKGGRVMILSYQPVLCKQNFDESWEWGTVTSLYASKFSSKQTTGAVIVGTVGTVVNALSTDFNNTRVDALLIDECLTGDSMIETDNGFERIDSNNLKDMKIKCISEDDGSIHYHKPLRVFSNGVRCVSSITTSCGVEIKCTDTHKLYSKGSWVTAASLKTGSEITLNASQDFVLRKLLRASVAVVKRLFQILA